MRSMSAAGPAAQRRGPGVADAESDEREHGARLHWPARWASLSTMGMVADTVFPHRTGGRGTSPRDSRLLAQEIEHVAVGLVEDEQVDGLRADARTFAAVRSTAFGTVDSVKVKISPPIHEQRGLRGPQGLPSEAPSFRNAPVSTIRLRATAAVGAVDEWANERRRAGADPTASTHRRRPAVAEDGSDATGRRCASILRVRLAGEQQDAETPARFRRGPSPGRARRRSRSTPG